MRILGFMFGETPRNRAARLPGDDAPVAKNGDDVCPLCGGTGVIPDTTLDGDHFMDPCASCGGTGRIDI